MTGEQPPKDPPSPLSPPHENRCRQPIFHWTEALVQAWLVSPLSRGLDPYRCDLFTPPRYTPPCFWQHASGPLCLPPPLRPEELQELRDTYASGTWISSLHAPERSPEHQAILQLLSTLDAARNKTSSECHRPFLESLPGPCAEQMFSHIGDYFSELFLNTLVAIWGGHCSGKPPVSTWEINCLANDIYYSDCQSLTEEQRLLQHQAWLTSQTGCSPLRLFCRS